MILFVIGHGHSHGGGHGHSHGSGHGHSHNNHGHSHGVEEVSNEQIKGSSNQIMTGKIIVLPNTFITCTCKKFKTKTQLILVPSIQLVTPYLHH